MKKLAFCLAVSTMVFGGTIVPELEVILSGAPPDTMIAVIVHTSLQADLSELPLSASYDDKIDYLRDIADSAQQGILAWLATTGKTWDTSHII